MWGDETVGRSRRVRYAVRGAQATRRFDNALDSLSRSGTGGTNVPVAQSPYRRCLVSACRVFPLCQDAQAMRSARSFAGLPT